MLRSANGGSRCVLVAALAALAAWSVVGAAPAPPISSEQPTDFGPDDALIFLHNYGYLNDSDFNASSTLEASFKEALTTYQRFSNLPITGTLDAATKEMMQTPRCGVKDINPHVSGELRQKRYAFTGSWFRKLHLTYLLQNAPPPKSPLSKKQAQDALKRATHMWSSVSQLTFSTAPRGVAADIDISFQRRHHESCESFDGRDGVLAHAFSTHYGRAYIHFDADEYWTLDKRGSNFFKVAVHELGHALGLDHSNVPNSVMEAHADHRQHHFRLHIDDIRGIQALYGSKNHFGRPNEDESEDQYEDECEDQYEDQYEDEDDEDEDDDDELDTILGLLGLLFY